MLQLVIGNKNYSSWSMRPWVLMKHFGLAFDEIKLRFDFTPGSAFYRELARHTPAGRVPVLLIDGFAVWDTLAIAEAVADRETGRALWPADVMQRARARSLCAEMHAGFGALRSRCPMNIEAALPEVGARMLSEHPAVATDLARIDAMWTTHGARTADPTPRGPASGPGSRTSSAAASPVAARSLRHGC
jgi:glutathione S-transferase